MITPLPRRWFTAGTNLAVWGDAGTYKAVPYELLPPLPSTKRDGSFDWLRAEPESKHGLDYGDDHGKPTESIHVRLGRIVDEAKKLGLTVPGELVRFVDDRTLHGRVPTCTACYLDVPAKLVPLPGGQPGHLLRFMNDQQVCLLWYVHLLPDGSHTVVCGWPKFDYDLPGDTIEDLSTPQDLVTCAPSFEEFVQRFWIENALWFSTTKKAPLSAAQQAYADAARSAVQ
ncbi:MAG TPA: hypothetical protein VLT33_40955 [Labilithrix sp.]|nr:hypothetical protein [Labilithrix sp.]